MQIRSELPWGKFPVVQWLGLCASIAEGLGSILGQETKLLKATRKKKTYNKVSHPSTPLAKMVIIKKSAYKKCWRGCGVKETACTVGGNVNWYSHGGKQRGFPGGASGKDPACQSGKSKRRVFDPWVEKIPWRRAWQPTPVFLLGESHGQRGLRGLQFLGLQGVRQDWSDLACMENNMEVP